MKLTRIPFPKQSRLRTRVAFALLLTLTLSHAGCFLDAAVEPYAGRVVVPRTQEFHWSDGGLPRTFDPAFAAAPPDTDLVRAIFEGLTDYDPRSLAPVPAVATSWEATNGGRVWTFYLRKDARWSNGEPVTADDFVRSWRRIVKIGASAPHTDLLANIEGAPKPQPTRAPAPTANSTPPNGASTANSTSSDLGQGFGAEAVSDVVLRVRLRRPDLNFPALVAHPVFRPVKVEESNATTRLIPENLVSNGAFSLARTGAERVLLERADHYWDRQQVALERVEFMGASDPESALAAYRAGEVDAVTNAAFEPLAIKLLTPYEDFRRTTYSALTYYTFNTAHEPFDDVRVREALALGFDRERVSADDLGGATEPAKRFLPEAVSDARKPVFEKSELLEKDYERARALLAEAGYPNGDGFPKVRLLINRNEQQRIVAQSIAAMWRNVLNIETEIMVKTWDEYEAAARAGDYDVVRRGMVMQTTDELTNIRALFGQRFESADDAVSSVTPSGSGSPETATSHPATARQSRLGAPPAVETESEALNDLSAIPIYFASSYALVKPYVKGFDSNVLDAPSLKTVRIDHGWKPREIATSSWTR
ncbi:MAG TPA: peptide ABC transporter substrate-binding protein [Pyrinomonadaceae bacterium]|nr:peptide ABC transporter substrate-binding protein [Pyrinomonadaceae bacterium]